MAQQDDQAASSHRKATHRKGKLIFIGAIAVVALVVYMTQRSGSELPNWPGNLQAALEKAKQEHRKVLVFFAANPPSTTARRMAKMTLPKNAAAIRKGRFITVLVRTESPRSDLARRYKLKRLPTFLLLDAAGVELNRRVGFVGEVPFRKGFLDCSEVRVP